MGVFVRKKRLLSMPFNFFFCFLSGCATRINPPADSEKLENQRWRRVLPSFFSLSYGRVPNFVPI